MRRERVEGAGALFLERSAADLRRLPAALVRRPHDRLDLAVAPPRRRLRPALLGRLAMVALASQPLVTGASRILEAGVVRSVLRNGQRALTPPTPALIPRGDTKVGTETSEQGGRVWE